MQELSSDIIGLDIYGPTGIFVGRVSDISFDTDRRHVAGLIVNEVNPALSEPGIVVSIPYEWISAVGDIVILKRFPTRLFRDAPPEGL